MPRKAHRRTMNCRSCSGSSKPMKQRHVSILPPDPIAAIKFRMDQAGLTQRDLIPILGSRVNVSEVLSGKRGLTMKMVRALPTTNLGIPEESLLQDTAILCDN